MLAFSIRDKLVEKVFLLSIYLNYVVCLVILVYSKGLSLYNIVLSCLNKVFKLLWANSISPLPGDPFLKYI